MLWRNLDKVTDSVNSAISATCLILVWTHYFRKRAWQNLAESYVVKLNSNRRRGTLASRCSFLIPWGELVFISFPVANISLFSFCSLARIQHSEHMWHFYSAAIWIFFDPEDSFYFWLKRKVYLNFCHFSLLILCWLSTIFVSKCPQRCVFLTKCIGWWWPCSLPFLLLGEISLSRVSPLSLVYCGCIGRMDKKCSTYRIHRTLLASSVQPFPRRGSLKITNSFVLQKPEHYAVLEVWCPGVDAYPLPLDPTRQRQRWNSAKSSFLRRPAVEKVSNRVHLHQLLLEAVEWQCCKKKVFCSASGGTVPLQHWASQEVRGFSNPVSKRSSSLCVFLY